MLRPTPLSTLFPYTTLFRSRRVSSRADRLSRRHRRSRGRLAPRRGTPGVRGRDRAAEDRKSTRLNSSHVKISYAVFCLKKKINYSDHITVTKKLISQRHTYL